MKTQTFLKQMALILSFLVGVALQTVAQPAGGVPRGPSGRTRFELTGDQQAKLREARQATEPERTQLGRKLAAAQKELVEAALVENPDEDTVRSKLVAVTKLQTELSMLFFKNLKEVTFTDEQKEQLTSLPTMGYSVLFGGVGPVGMPGGGSGGGARVRAGGGGGSAGSGGEVRTGGVGATDR